MQNNMPSRRIQVLQSDEIYPEIDPGMLIIDGNRKYEVGRMIAEGGMGAIYEAYDTNCKRTVAMKVLHPSTTQTAEELLRFVEEAQITSQLEHPNIVPIHEVGLDSQSRVYFTMKHVKGKTLTDVLVGIRRNEPEMIENFPLNRLINILQKVCDAVAFAHAHHVLHRDLKPDNIMIAEYGEVLVVDWGLAKIMISGETETHPSKRDELCELDDAIIHSLREDDIGSGFRTMNGYIMGTPGFMAPEQVSLDHPTLRLQSDIYSLGAILYSILTLRPPLRVTQYETSKALIQAVHENKIRPPVDFNKRDKCDTDETFIFPHSSDGNIPEPLSRIAMHALATKPESRYASVLHLQNDLESYQTGNMWYLVTDDDMSNPQDLSHWEIYGGKHEIVDGALRINGGEPQVLLFRQELPGDIRIEYECSIQSIYLNNLGCFIGAIKAGNRNTIPYSGYELCFGAFDNSLNLLSRADQKIWTQAASPLERNKNYKICAERCGDTLSLTVNDCPIFSYKDSDPLFGADRSAIGLYGWLSDIRYTRVRIYARGTPWMADILDIAERQMQKGNYKVARTLYQETLDSYPSGRRFKRAEAGLEQTYRREKLGKQIIVWKNELQKVWPDATLEISMANENLTLEIVNCGITDISPLAGLPLSALYCHNNQIESLEPLRGMKLEMLNCGGNPIQSLEPLHGMPLKVLACEGARIDDLSPLRGMPLTLLNCGGCGRIESLAPLQGMPVNFLSCWGNKIQSLQPLIGMKLTGLFCGGNQIRDLTPLRFMPIKILHCSGNQIASLDTLKTLELSRLHCAGNKIEDLEPLRNMPLTMLSCQTNRITSLAPIANANLGTLSCGNNQLTDIEPFSDNPPQDLLFYCDTIPLSELKALCDRWVGRAELKTHLVHVRTLLALRENRISDLHKLALTYGDSLYLYIPRFMTWAAAKKFCEEYKGNLVSVLSAAENDFITRMFPKGCWFWMGLYKTEDDIFWTDGSLYEYDNFNEPLQRNKVGPKVFNDNWNNEDTLGAENCFMIKWPSSILNQ